MKLDFYMIRYDQKEESQMKKALGLLLCIALIICSAALVGCGGGSSDGSGKDLSDSKYVGTWKAVSMSIGDDEEPYEDTCIMTLKDDGTGTLESDDETSEFTWELTDGGFKTKGDMKMKFTDNGDLISGKILGANLNFEKQ